ncbi:MAG: hypothetical protein CME62_15915 [Halobacteriovoraceae bacterium]|nr:hypothetical protein [Halobacteriovoraceae bacterium]|tara:strand:- start:1575 stop:2831 length:1257 start_codon:yes stop_codon:yes gene_type:complete
MSKNITKIKDQFFASCPTGLEELLAAEIKKLDYQKLKVVKGGVHFDAMAKVAMELVLSSRIASRIYKKMFVFTINSEKNLHKKALEIKWKSVFNLDQTFKISVVQGMSEDGKHRSKFKSTLYLAQNLKDAIVDRYRKDADGERPSVSKDDPDINLLLRVEPITGDEYRNEECTILLDLCGAPLNHRGYRDTNFAAPLKENLAAGIVMLTGYTGKEHFIDAMCGSGTLIIESLLIKGDLPPSYLLIEDYLKTEKKHWKFLAHNWFVKDKYLTAEWKEIAELYLTKVKAGYKNLEQAKVQTLAYDKEKYSRNAIGFNLKAAKLQDYVRVEAGDATELAPPVDSGIVVANPPYGHRLEQDKDLSELYHNFGENLKKNFKGFKAYIFTGNMPLIKKISLRTSRKDILWNGNIESRLVEYDLY